MICKYKSTKLNRSKYRCISLTIQLSIDYLFIQLNDQIAIFLTVQFSKSFICTQFKYQTVRFNPYQVLPLLTRVSYLGHSLMRVLPLHKNAVGVFYSPSQLG